MADMSVSALMGWAGFILGIVFGGVAQKTNFCTMGSISDMVLMGDKRRFRAWILAIAVGLLGTQLLNGASWAVVGEVEPLDIYASIYLTSNFGWLGAILGGLMFGFGMTRAGGCANKTLVRIGGGNLKSVVVALVLGVFAYMTVRGLIGLARVWMENHTNVDLSTTLEVSNQGIPDIIAAFIGLDVALLRWVITALIAIPFILWCFKDADFRSSPRDIAAGIILGLLVPAGWWATGILGGDPFDPTQPSSFTFVNPTGESIMYLMTFTGSTINFGIGTVGGVIVGSFLVSIVTRSFHIESFNGTADMWPHLYGAALMGVGGVLALGCTVGQGMTGVTTLSLGSYLAWLSIVAGGYVGMKTYEEGSFWGGVRAAITFQ